MRARNLKPGFFRNEYLSSLDPLVRLLFAGLWCLADREGRLEDRPGKIKIAVLPSDDCDVEQMLGDLARPQGPDGERFIRRYTVGGKRCIQVLNFVRHQNPHIKEAASLLPAPPVEVDATQWASDAPILHQESTVLAAETHQTSPADSLIPDSFLPDSLIPDSLIPDSLIADSLIADSLIPDSLIADSLIPIRLLTSSAKPAAEDLRWDSFQSTKQTANYESPTRRHESPTKNPKAQIKNSGTQTNRPKSSNPCVSPPNEDAIEEKPANPSYPPEFEQFWQQYPRQTEKKRAFRVWRARIKDK
ncbi:MAG: hypothetical protein NTU59_01155, partial [Coprothermobacterota bacterium]|nr:hypothetical protein [Coprothermobacterota bacterium]